METFDFPEAHVAKLVEFDSVDTKGLPSGCCIVQKNYHYGLFSLETGELVIPVAYGRIYVWHDGLFYLEELANYRYHGLYSWQTRSFVIPVGAWSLSCCTDHVFVRADTGGIAGIFSLTKGNWLFSLERGCRLSESHGPHTKRGERFFVTIHRVTQKQGLFSTTRGVIFDEMYERVRAHDIDGMFIASAEQNGTKEYVVLVGEQFYKLPPFIDVEVRHEHPAPPLFIVKTEHGSGIYDSDSGSTMILSSEGGRVRHWRDELYVGVSPDSGYDRGSSQIYDASKREHAWFVDYELMEPIDDDRWFVRDRGRIGVYSLRAKALLVPAEWKSLSHVYGDVFFAEWQGTRFLVDIRKKEIPLLMALGAPTPPVDEPLQMPPLPPEVEFPVDLSGLQVDP